MKVDAERLSIKKDNTTWCRPSSGYAVSDKIDPDEYIEVATTSSDLPESDETWPKGAPVDDHLKVGNKILKKR